MKKVTKTTASSRRATRIGELVRALSLRAHPEGGAFTEHYRAGDDSSTAIYYLLSEGAGSVWHRVLKDELWHHYDGEIVELHVITEGPLDVEYEILRLGPVGRGVRPCVCVPAGSWQAARITRRKQGPGFALVGCTIAPGFRFTDWRLAEPGDLARLGHRIPRARKVLRALAPRSAAVAVLDIPSV